MALNVPTAGSPDSNLPNAGTLTVAEICTRVKRQFGDEAGAQINDADIIRWINDAVKEIAVNNDLLQVRGVTNVLGGTAEYQIPLDMLTLRSIKYDGQVLKALSIQEATELIPDNDVVTDATGTPSRYWVWANVINLHPAPNSDGVLTIYYTRHPVPVVAQEDVPELSGQYHNRLVEYCIAQAYELDSDLESYRAKMGQFQEGMDRLKDNSTWGNQDVYPSITMSADEIDGWG